MPLGSTMLTPSSRMVPGASISNITEGGSAPRFPGRGARSASVSLTPRVDLGFYGGYLGLQQQAPPSNGRRASMVSVRL